MSTEGSREKKTDGFQFPISTFYQRPLNALSSTRQRVIKDHLTCNFEGRSVSYKLLYYFFDWFGLGQRDSNCNRQIHQSIN